MALYSWFLRTNKKPKIKSNNNELLKASRSVKYIENYTMWPTAKIKSNAEITPPSYIKVDDKAPPQQKTLLTTETTLTVIKS